MGDFPNYSQLPLTIWTFSRYSMLTQGVRGTQGASGAFASSAWGTANLAQFVPFELPMPYPCKTLFWENGITQAGNIDVGVYTDDLVKVCSTGSTAQNANTVALQFAAASPDVILQPGAYYFAISTNSTTCTIYSQLSGTITHLRELGLFQQATAFPLPASATPAAYSTIARVPLLGMTYKTGTPTF